MTLEMLVMSRHARSLALIALLVAGIAGAANAGLSNAERLTLDQPSCAQMKAFSQDVALLSDELRNVRKFKQRGRLCDVLGRAKVTIGSTIDYMQTHIGECTITSASLDQMTALGRQFEGDRRKLCR